MEWTGRWNINKYSINWLNNNRNNNNRSCYFERGKKIDLRCEKYSRRPLQWMLGVGEKVKPPTDATTPGPIWFYFFILYIFVCWPFIRPVGEGWKRFERVARAWKGRKREMAFRLNGRRHKLSDVDDVDDVEGSGPATPHARHFHRNRPIGHGTGALLHDLWHLLYEIPPFLSDSHSVRYNFVIQMRLPACN